MIATLSTLLGGIGLFLLGMTLMTDGLKAVAGDALRSMLANFTGSRAKAVATGAGITALVQSSSATTLATIGFVSAGLLSFNNAIGVVIGANLGTTSTGWIVSLLGLKFSIGTILLPFIGVGALMRLLGRGRIAHSGTVLAGLGVIFVGIDVMQAGMGDLANQVDLSQYSAAGLQARFLLVVIGAVMTVLMQSSSAAVATTLTALAAGTISVEQAAALVIGQNVGTTVTAGIASVGASVAAKRTAFVHVVFNLGTAFIAFFILPLFTALIDIFTEQLVGDDEALTIAAFHTAFNLLGAAVFLPLTQKLDRLASYVVVEKRPALTRLLDQTMCQVPSLAVNAAYETLKQCAVITLKNGAARLRGEQSEIINHALTEVRQATNDTGEFLAKLPSVDTPVLARLTASLHAMDHISQCANDVSLLPAMSKLRTIKDIREQADLLADLFAAGSEALSLPMESDLAAVIQQFDMGLNIDDDARTAILQLASDHVLDVDKALDALAVLRSLDRLSHHGARAMHYLHQLNEETPETPSLAEVDKRTVG